MGICNILANRKQNVEATLTPIDVFGMGIIICFYIGACIILYPDHLRNITDISRHYSEALPIIHQPDQLTQFFFLLGTAFDSVSITLSRGTIQQNMIALFGTNMNMPFSVYAAAKRVFEKDSYKAIIVALFFIVLNAAWGSINLLNPHCSLAQS